MHHFVPAPARMSRTDLFLRRLEEMRELPDVVLLQVRPQSRLLFLLIFFAGY
jgi:hypothetical protein